MEHGISNACSGPRLIAVWGPCPVRYGAGDRGVVAIRTRTRRVDVEAALEAFRALDIDAFRNWSTLPRRRFSLRDHLPREVSPD